MQFYSDIIMHSVGWEYCACDRFFFVCLFCFVVVLLVCVWPLFLCVFVVVLFCLFVCLWALFLCLFVCFACLFVVLLKPHAALNWKWIGEKTKTMFTGTKISSHLFISQSFIALYSPAMSVCPWFSLLKASVQFWTVHDLQGLQRACLELFFRTRFCA